MTSGRARSTGLAALALWALLLPSGAGAESTALEPLTRRDQLLGWEAVGRLDIAAKGREGSFCTGTLIATDLVLTAAHCVYDGQGRPEDPAAMTFRAGFADGTSVAEARVKRSVAMPGYDPATPVSQANVRNDVALLQLETPIPAAVAAPFQVHAPGKGDAVSVVSYAIGRKQSLSWQRECRVLERGQGLVATDCDVTFGASGAPVFDRSGDRARIVSIISAGGPTERGTVAFGMELPQAVDELKARLARGEVLAEAGALPAAAAAAPALPAVRRLGIGDGTSRDIGARFVKPKAPAPGP